MSKDFIDEKVFFSLITGKMVLMSVHISMFSISSYYFLQV
jgi:hypothetical protein